MKTNLLGSILLVAILATVSCKKDDSNTAVSKDITTAEKVSVDRFSADAGTLFVRNDTNGLPAANAAIDFDQEPFISKGLSPTGSSTSYYNFDVQPTTPSPIYVFFEDGASSPVTGQNNVIGDIPGDTGYNDFWLVNKVIVPSDYVPNSITNESDVLSSGYNIVQTTNIVNCPVVPFGSTATKRLNGGNAGLTLGWYNDMAVAYFTFEEASLMTTGSSMVPLSPIYVMFNDNMAGPASGFRTETGTDQTHNVVATEPGDAGYSPLWLVNVVDNADFSSVMDLSSAQSATILASGVANVNCPIVE